MELRELLLPKYIKMKLSSRTKEEVLKELIDVLVQNNLVQDQEVVWQKALEREAKGSTGVGKGIAIPHIKSEAVLKPTLVFGKSEAGVDFDSLDGKPAHLFFLIAVPEEADQQYLKILANLSRRLMKKEFREALMAATTAAEVEEVICKN